MGKQDVYYPGMQDQMSAEEFRRTRERVGMTQAQFAEHIDVHEKSITRYESGRETVRPWMARLIRALFGQGAGVKGKGRNQPVVGQSARKRAKR
jgi:DNA-binding XRE family transcriptional regulator